jgi:hypothetical protein
MSEQISNNKWKSLSKRLSGMIKPVSLTPKNVYDELRAIFRAQSDFFAPVLQKNPYGYVRVVYYTYSLLKTGNFDLGDKIIQNLGFASILTTENETFYDTCDNCGGDGSVNCNECDGNGLVDCNNCDSGGKEDCFNCDGDGLITCDTCDGEGKDEEGNECGDCGGDGAHDCSTCAATGKVECSVCDGDKEMTCPECNGNGYEDCSSCYGSGEQETDEIKYEKYDICTYNKDIKNSCELNANTLTPIMTTDNSFDEFWENVIVLKNYEEHAEALENIESDDIYCFFYDTNPGIYVGRGDLALIINEGEEDFYFDV